MFPRKIQSEPEKGSEFDFLFSIEKESLYQSVAFAACSTVMNSEKSELNKSITNVHTMIQAEKSY
jgi:hypothetical protein